MYLLQFTDTLAHHTDEILFSLSLLVSVLWYRTYKKLQIALEAEDLLEDLCK